MGRGTEDRSPTGGKVMSQQALQRLVGTAVVDRRFRQGFFNGKRQHLLAQFELAADERETVLSIREDTLEGFAEELERRLYGVGRGRCLDCGPRQAEARFRPAYAR